MKELRTVGILKGLNKGEGIPETSKKKERIVAGMQCEWQVWRTDTEQKLSQGGALFLATEWLTRKGQRGNT